MSKIEDGGPAFPVNLPGFGDNGASGMSLRDWLAGQAITASVAKIEAGITDYERCSILKKKRDQLGGETQQELTAALAYAYADAMLIERSKVRSR